MRPFFVGAAVLAILGALVFFISPAAIVLHRQIFLELMLPAAYGGFLVDVYRPPRAAVLRFGVHGDVVPADWPRD